MEILLAIVGVFLAIMALPWLKRPVEAMVRRLRERVIVGRALRDTLPAVRSIRSGLRSTVIKDFMMCQWDHLVRVDAEGNTETTIECLVALCDPA
jgi:hypothetical protein